MREQRGVVGQSPAARISSSGATNSGTILDVAHETADETHVVEVGPVGVPRFEPLLIATDRGTTAFHTAVSPREGRDIVETLEDGEPPTDGAHAVVSHDPETPTLPRPEEGPLAVGDRVALARCGWVVPPSVGWRTSTVWVPSIRALTAPARSFSAGIAAVFARLIAGVRVHDDGPQLDFGRSKAS